MLVDNESARDHDDSISGMGDIVTATANIFNGAVGGALGGAAIGFGLLYSDGDYSTGTYVALTGLSALVGMGAGIFGASREYR